MTSPATLPLDLAHGLPGVTGLCWVRVALDVPLPGLFDYRSVEPIAVGMRVVVPFGRRQMVGVVMETPAEPAVAESQVKNVLRVLDDLPPLPADWMRLASFAAEYYQRPLGEVMLPSLPGPLRKPTAYEGKRSSDGPVARLDGRAARSAQAVAKALEKETRAAEREAKAQAKLAKALEKEAKARAKAGGIPAEATVTSVDNYVDNGVDGAVDKSVGNLPDNPVDNPVGKAKDSVASAVGEARLAGFSEGGVDSVPSAHATDTAHLADMAHPIDAGFLGAPEHPADSRPRLGEAQQAAVDALASLQGFKPVLLHGVTGSGKTEVYLHAAERVLAQGRQVMLLVPEINLTPQLEGVLRGRLEAMAGPGGVAVLHSGLADGERLEAWLRIVRGQARVLLGTRLALFTPLPDLGLIVVDEEHDPSYKQQEGLRYSARDLAIWRARDLDIPVVLGSATPSLETWHHAESGRYLRLSLPDRALAAAPPTIKLIDTRRLQLKQGLSPQVLTAVADRLALGQQSLIFLNRRGYAPVLNCESCGWVSGCQRCSAYMVLHRAPHGRHELRCHHCGWYERVPMACPDCGNQDLQPMGRGTQRLEEHLAELFPDARIARIDADSTRRKGSAHALFSQMHAGEIDILVGTQMVAKGHDFQNLGFVGVLNADAMLFSHDFRAPERLFAQLMQVAGRAGRSGVASEVYVQTGYPEQPLYQSLVRHDYAGFARYALEERASAGLPPFAHQALLTAEARELAQAVEFLAQARDAPEAQFAAGGDISSPAPDMSRITLYDPVPLRVVRVANVERAQLLVESDSRPALQGFLRAWSAVLSGLPAVGKVRWHLEVDPLEI